MAYAGHPLYLLVVRLPGRMRTRTLARAHP